VAGEALDVLEVRRTAPSVLGWSPDGKTLVSAGSDPPFLLIDPDDTAKRWEFEGHGWPVGAIEFAPDGAWFVSRDRSGLIVFWRTDTDPWTRVPHWRPVDRPRTPTAVPLLAIHPRLPRLAQHNDDCTGVAVHELDLAIMFGEGVATPAPAATCRVSGQTSAQAQTSAAVDRPSRCRRNEKVGQSRRSTLGRTLARGTRSPAIVLSFNPLLCGRSAHGMGDAMRRARLVVAAILISARGSSSDSS
jgi:hypothetical protein